MLGNNRPGSPHPSIRWQPLEDRCRLS